MSELSIAEEDPRTPDVVAMIAELDAAMLALYRPEACHFMSPDQLVAGGCLLFVARRSGEAVGCAALVPRGDGAGELKRMWTAPGERGQGVGRTLCRAVAAQAADDGLSVLRLETGVRQPEAQGLFLSEGFVKRGPFPPYADDPDLVFMEKRVTIGAGEAA